MTSIIDYSYHLLLEILPVFLLAIIASSLIDKFLPDDFIPRFTARHNEFFAILNASIIGSLLPLCTCGMIPLAVKLHQKGLNWKPLAAFLISGNACSIPAVILTASISYKLALIRLLASVVFGLITSYVLGWIANKNFQFEITGIAHSHEQDDCCHPEHKKSLFRQIADDVKQMLKDFLPWIILAVIIAALVNHYANTNDLIRSLLLEPTITTISPLLASIAGFPFYFCAGADVPLSKEFFELGLPLGTIISFMLASPGVNATSLLIYQKAIGLKQASLLIFVSILCSSIIGIILNIQPW